MSKSPTNDFDSLRLEVQRLHAENANLRKEIAVLAEEAALFRVLADSAMVGVNINQDGHFVYVNDRLADMFGYDEPQKLLGRCLWDMVHPDDLDKVKRRIRQRLCDNGTKTKQRFRGLRADGGVIWVDSHTSQVFHHGKPAALAHLVDVTSQQEAETALTFAYSELDQLFNIVASAVCVISADRTVLRVNHAFQQLFGPDARNVVGRKCDQAWLHGRCKGGDCPLERIIAGETKIEYRMERKGPDGAPLNIIVTAVPFRGPDGQLLGIVENFIDVTQLKRSEEQIAFQAYHDALTGLPNRLLFNDRLNMAMAHAQRQEQGLAVLFLDLDHFKTINDSLGHAVGDSLLQAVAERLQGVLRDEDTAARIGGDEFMVLLQSATDPESAGVVAERLLEVVSGPFAISGYELYVTASIGVTLFPHDGQDPESLTANADMAMYRAKEDGRNTYRMFTPAMNQQVIQRLAMENDLRKAMEREEFVVHYQPKVSLDSGCIMGAEALVRWMRPGNGGLVPPGEFIPLAEENGMIVGIGQWVLRQACLAAKGWHDMGFGSLCVAVNLSPRQFNQRDLVDVVRSALDESGLPAQCLELEVTENAVMNDVDRAIETMRQLSDLGVHLSMDDFGRGYSSLYHLKRFPMDSLKIDRLFIRDALNSDDEALLVNTIIAMSKSMNLEVVAEGVETEAQLDFLRRNECDQTQGFLFSKPLPGGELSELLTSCGGRLDGPLNGRKAATS